MQRCHSEESQTKSFMTRIANRIFAQRELSSIDVTNHILGFDTYYASQTVWQWVHTSPLYWKIAALWTSLSSWALESDMQGPTLTGSEESYSFEPEKGIRPSILQAYEARGDQLRPLCLYDYMACVYITPKPKKRWPVSCCLFDGIWANSGYCQQVRRPTTTATPVINGALPGDGDGDTHYAKSHVVG